MTSNVCSKSLGISDPIGFISCDEKDDIYKMLKSSFKDEFLNRIDEIIKFKALDMQALKLIAQKKLTAICEKAKEKNIILEFTETVTETLAKKAIKEKQSARSLLRLVSSEIEFQLISYINAENKSELKISIDASEDEIFFEQLNLSLI